VEGALSIYLENFATTLGSREQLAIAEFADALLVIPKVSPHAPLLAWLPRPAGGGGGGGPAQCAQLWRRAWLLLARVTQRAAWVGPVRWRHTQPALAAA
jgi:hypothetical protein